MKWKSPILFFTLLIAVACGSNSTYKKTISKEGKIIEFAEHFELIQDSGFVRLHILDAENKSIKFKAVLAKKVPSSLPKDYVFIQTPVKRMIALSSTHIGMLSKLEGINSVVGVSNQNYLDNKELIDRTKSGKAIELGDEGMIPMESIVRSQAELIVFSDFGNPFPHAAQLTKLGFTILPNVDWREEQPLGKAEWIKLYGYLIGKEKESIKIFNSIKEKYLELKQEMKLVSKRPSVISGNLIGDIWYAPNGKSYNAQLISDAGGEYVYAKTEGTGSIMRSMEQILSENRSTKFWINPGFKSKQEITVYNPKLKLVPAFQNNQVYCYSARMNYFWEMSAVEPHLVMEDLILIFHPELAKKKTFNFYSRIN
ncbi:MAG: ABC transporter substrate-binding protein [Crocinitomicaceae bacterium]|nr:ABC transporter substrate-binding protein [Crocinitomicaceae bacterium]